MNIVYLNGKYLEKNNAKVSVFDRGFTFGDGVYEVIPIYNNSTMLRFDEHYARLLQSLDKVDISPSLSAKALKEIVTTLIQKNVGDSDDCACYLQITRGEDITRNHVINDDITPTIFACLVPFQKNNPKPTYKVQLAEDIRWHWCHVKAITLLPNIVLMNTARKAGLDDIILARGDTVTEGASSNVFIVKNGKVATPIKNNHILGGITRDFLLEVARKHQIDITERNITRDELLSADEVFLTGSAKEIQHVTQIDDTVINQEQPGPVTIQLRQYFQEEVDNISNECAVTT